MPDEIRFDLSPAYLSIGSNIGEREANVLGAVRAIQDAGIVRRIRVSSLYETAPVDCQPMDDFVNAVVEVQPLHYPGDLLKRLQTLEKRLGRRSGHNEPRVVDIDIVALGRKLIRNDGLSVPHARYHARRFVLVPLQEIAPDFRCPASGKAVAEMIAALPAGQDVTRICSRKVIIRSNHVR